MKHERSTGAAVQQSPSSAATDPATPGRRPRTQGLVQRKASGGTGTASSAGGASTDTAASWMSDPGMLAAHGFTGAVQRKETGEAATGEGGHEGGHVHVHGAEGPQGETGAPQVQGGGGNQGVMTSAAARTLLQNAFGGYRQIDAGNVRVLAQADFETAYDAIYGNSQYSWAQYVVPNFGNLNGFAHNGVNYINRDSANVTTVPHEMLHNNAAGDWRPFVGSPFDEGATEYLEQYALRHGNIQTNLTHYPNQRAVVETYLASGVAQADLFRAYLAGGAATIVGQWVDDNCSGTWAQVKAAMDQSNWATARAHLAPNQGGQQGGQQGQQGGQQGAQQP